MGFQSFYVFTSSYSCQEINIMWSVNFCKTIKNDLKSTKEVQNLRTTHKVNYHGLLLLHLISPPTLYMITFSPSFNYIPTRIKFLFKKTHPPNFCMISNTGVPWDTIWFSKIFMYKYFKLNVKCVVQNLNLLFIVCFLRINTMA